MAVVHNGNCISLCKILGKSESAMFAVFSVTQVDVIE